MLKSHDLRTPTVLVVAALLVLAGCAGGPTGPIPGGMLDGTQAVANADWSQVEEVGIGELETNPSDPYSVTLAYVVMDGNLYLNAGHSQKKWVENTLAYPDVRFRIDGQIHNLRASRVDDAEELARFGKLWTQGWFRRDPTQYDEVWVFRLVPRAAAG